MCILDPGWPICPETWNLGEVLQLKIWSHNVCQYVLFGVCLYYAFDEVMLWFSCAGSRESTLTSPSQKVKQIVNYQWTNNVYPKLRYFISINTIRRPWNHIIIIHLLFYLFGCNMWYYLERPQPNTELTNMTCCYVSSIDSITSSRKSSIKRARRIESSARRTKSWMMMRRCKSIRIQKYGIMGRLRRTLFANWVTLWSGSELFWRGVMWFLREYSNNFAYGSIQKKGQWCVATRAVSHDARWRRLFQTRALEGVSPATAQQIHKYSIH